MIASVHHVATRPPRNAELDAARLASESSAERAKKRDAAFDQMFAVLRRVEVSAATDEHLHASVVSAIRAAEEVAS